MKVHQIIAEGPRREPSLGSLTPTASATPTPTSVDIRRSQVLGPDGRPFFTVVDQDGKELFRGTEEQANIKRDEIQRRIRPAAAPRTQAAPAIDPDEVRSPSTTTPRTAPTGDIRDTVQSGWQRFKGSKVGKFLKGLTSFKVGGVVGALASFVSNFGEIEDLMDDYLQAIISSGGFDTQEAEVARTRVARRLTEATVEGVLAAAIAGAGTVAIAFSLTGIGAFAAAFLLGGIAIYGADWVEDKLKDWGWTDWVFRTYDRYIFAQNNAESWSLYVDGIQKTLDLPINWAADFIGAPRPDVFADESIKEEAEETSSNPDEAFRALATKIRQAAADDPEVKQAMQAGAKEIKKIKAEAPAEE